MKRLLSLVLSVFVGFACLAGSTAAIAVNQNDDPALTPINAAYLFEVHCVGCHPNGGNIIRRGKNLKSRALERYGADNLEAIARLIANGKNSMSAFRDRLTDPEIQALSAYVLQRAKDNWRT